MSVSLHPMSPSAISEMMCAATIDMNEGCKGVRLALDHGDVIRVTVWTDESGQDSFYLSKVKAQLLADWLACQGYRPTPLGDVPAWHGKLVVSA